MILSWWITFHKRRCFAREKEKWSQKDVYSFFVDVDDLDESILDFGNIHDQNCRQYLSREDACPFFGEVMEGGREEEDYYQKIKHHTFLRTTNISVDVITEYLTPIHLIQGVSIM